MSGLKVSAATADSPLNRLRLQAGFTVEQIARRFGVTRAAASRWLSGDRTAPPGLVVALQQAAVGDPDSLAEAQAQYARERRRRRTRPAITLTTRLPEGITIEQAQERCAEALAELAAEVGQQ